MASIGKDKGGRKRILYVASDGRRRVVRLGKATLRQAEAFKVKFEALIAGRLAGSIDAETARWVGDMPDDMHAKLAGMGLVEPREASRDITLGELLDRYCQARTDIKASTVLVWQQARQSLLDYFGADKLLREIHEGDAELWRLAMVGQGFAEATIRKRCQNAKQFMAFAIRQKLASSNPFAGLKSSAKANDSRLYFVSQGDFAKVLDSCPDSEWRLLLALARYGGLRTPSETLALEWSHIDWEQGRILVTSPKTANHGKASRTIPLFGELRPYLLDAFDQAEPGATYCINRYRESNANLRTQAHRIIRRAGLEPWPRTFQNLRASRETELTETYPLATVVSWLGNSQPTALKHYLSVSDEHFARAAQNPAQSGAEQSAGSRTEQKANRTEDPENADMLVGAGTCDTLHNTQVAPRGFEPLLPG